MGVSHLPQIDRKLCSDLSLSFSGFQTEKMHCDHSWENIVRVSVTDMENLLNKLCVKFTCFILQKPQKNCVNLLRLIIIRVCLKKSKRYF